MKDLITIIGIIGFCLMIYSFSHSKGGDRVETSTGTVIYPIE